jgi:hypothetical protein
MRVVLPYIKLHTKTFEFGRKNRQVSDKSSRRRWLVPAAVVTALIIVSLGIWRTLSSPSYGQVAKTTEDTSPKTKLPEYTSLTTNYYTVNYSGRYSQQPTDIPPAGILDQKILAYQLGGQAGQSRFEIDIKSAPDGGITLDSNYIYYQQHPTLYKLSNKLYRGEIVDIAKKTSGSPEEDALWLHGSFLMVIKLTTADKNQAIDTELKDMLASVQWRQ